MNVNACLGALLAAGATAAAAPPWPESLSGANRGLWMCRLPIEVTNRGAAAEGEPVTVPAAALAGERFAALRVCEASGRELLFELLRADGTPRREGVIQATDRLTVPVSCGPATTAVLFAYAGSCAAWPVPEFLPAGFRNGGAESGRDEPEAWSAGETDATHRASWETQAGRGGSRCLAVRVDEGASPQWVQWRQERIPVVPGRSYAFGGWVRTANVQGGVGWYVHVHGDTDLVLNRHADGRAGTHGWEEAHGSFVAPAGARTATIGTVLRGTGQAWYDDALFEAVADSGGIEARVGTVERLTLADSSRPQDWREMNAPARAVIRACNLSDQTSDAVRVVADLRPMGGRWMNLRPEDAIGVYDCSTGRRVEDAMFLGKRMLAPATLPAKSLRYLHVYLQSGSGEHARAERALVAAARGPGNLARPLSAATGGELGWQFNGDALRSAAGRDGEAPSGQGRRFSAEANTNGAWIGWTSAPLPVRPGRQYLLAGLVRPEGAADRAAIHAHLRRHDGALASGGGMLSTAPATNGAWTAVHSMFRAPEDAETITLHLTMNTSGTLRHDAILLCEAQAGEVVGLESRLTPPRGAMMVWAADPLVKVFRDDPPASRPAGPVEVELARRERESFQLVAYAGASAPTVRVTATPLRHESGATLPPAKVERVGYVPVDHPTAYYQDDGPPWARRVPRGEGATDGWAGEWPDPLIPTNGAAIAAGQNQPFWFTVAAGPESAPGIYRGEVVFESDGGPAIRVPVSARVLPFTLPVRPRLGAILDLRTGPGGDFGSGIRTGATRRAWLRFLAEHRVGIDEIQPSPAFTLADGGVRMDASGFDEEARYCFDELGMAAAYTPHFFYSFGWAYTPRPILGCAYPSAEYDDVLKGSLRLFADHLRARGWHDRFRHYLSDEPHFSHPFVVDQMKQLCAMIHASGSGIPIYSSTWRHCPAWDAALDVWGVGQYGCFPVEELERLKKAGKGFWFTCDGQMAIDTPYLATERLLPYYCHRYGAGGFEFWGVSWWTYNPWKFGWHSYISQSDDGTRQYWVRYPDGDGYLAYPGAAVGVAGPVSSIRMEQVREGLEDYEALRTLEDLAAKAEGSRRVEAEKALAAARALVTIPNAGGIRSLDLLRDPAEVGRVRRSVNRAIEDLAGSRTVSP